MPGMDGTGPEGKGSGTGRRLGKCSKASEETESPKLGRGLGRRHLFGGGSGQGKRSGGGTMQRSSTK